jgi:hypothetical protein
MSAIYDKGRTGRFRKAARHQYEARERWRIVFCGRAEVDFRKRSLSPARFSFGFRFAENEKSTVGNDPQENSVAEDRRQAVR